MKKLLIIVLALWCLSFDAYKAASYVVPVSQGEGFCAGTAIKYKGHKYIVTAFHCVNSGEDIVANGQPVELLGFNIAKDIAILSVPPTQKDFTTIQAKLPPPDTTIRILGFPGGKFLLSRGVISSPCHKFGKHTAFAIDAMVWRGNSGGPVLSEQEEFLGIVSFGYPDLGTWGWAVCASEVVKVLDKMGPGGCPCMNN